MAFIDVIRDVLAELGMSTGDFEARTGLSANNFQSWATREGIRPRRSTLEVIEQALGIEFEYGKGVRNVVGWRKRGQGEGEEASEAPLTDAPGRYDELFVRRLRSMLDDVRRRYAPSQETGDAMDDGDAVLYEALFRMLVRRIETITEDAETAIRREIREFESELDRRKIAVREQKEGMPK